MAVGRYKKKQLKIQNEQSLCRCVIAVFQVAVFCQSVSSITAQDYFQSSVQADGIIQSSNVFPQPEVDVDISPIAVQFDSNQEVTSQADVIRFEPAYLDFDVQPIGIPNMRIVHVYNPSKTKSLLLNSISARTSHFHSSFFDKKVVPAKGNTTFEVVFLARVVGNVENTLFINTAVGAFSYQVFGVGVPNPYRLRPYLGAKVSLNSTFSPLISMHNPTGIPLQVTEIYTSSGYLHLQLPIGMAEGKKQLWEIPPYETRPVMQASFLGQVVDNHTAFIRIRTNHTDFAQYLILAMEVEVTSASGIYSSLETLDFGTLRSKDQPKTLSLFLLNSGSKEVQVSSVTAQPANPSLRIDFAPLKLKPTEATYTRVANISFDVRKVKSDDQWTGTILVRTKEKSYTKLSIPYQVNVLDGNLGYEESFTYFHIPIHDSTKPAARQNITITNTFAFPIVLHKLELPDNTANYYQISNFSSPCIVAAQETRSCFSLTSRLPAFQTLSAERLDILNSIHHIILHTNASTFSMPLQAYTGLLTFKVQGGNLPELDFNIMGTLDKRSVILSLDNLNPLPVTLLDFNTSVSGVEVNILALRKEGEGADNNIRTQYRNIVLPPGSSLKLEVVLSAPKTEAVLAGTLDVYTNYEKLEIPLKARIAIGSLTLKPSKFKFRPTFPGSIIQQTLTITSSFAQTMKIESLTCDDKRFYYRKHRNVGVELEPGKELKIGKVYFDAKQACKPGRCYVGLPTSTTVGHHWLTTMSLGKNAAEVDSKLYKNHQDYWKKLKQENVTSINDKFRLSTNLVRNFEIDVSASLYWPSLVNEPVYEFPLTHIGKKWITQVPITNPSDIPVIVQILPIGLYPQPRVALDVLELEHLTEVDGFSYADSNIFNVSLAPNSSTQDTSSQMVWLEYTLNGKTNKTCVNMYLNPGQKQVIDVTFSPINDMPVSTLILIRNNLTVLDSFQVKGRGVKEILKLGGKLPNSHDSSLKFLLTKQLLRDCFVQNRKDKASPSFTVRKSFTAKNLGLLQLQVRYLMVDNYPCEGYGFRILDCDPFVLQPNETKEIIIAYTPDFTTSQVSHTLRIWTSQANVLTFNLNVSLPHQLLPTCQSSIPRPYWEKPLYFGFMTLTLLGFVGIMLISYLEAMNILEPYIVAYDNEMIRLSKERKPFNLHDIANDMDNLNENGSHKLKYRSAISRSFSRNHKFTFNLKSILKTISRLPNTVLSFDIGRFFKHDWSRKLVTIPKTEPINDVFDKPVPAVPPELLHNNILHAPHQFGNNGNNGNSKSRHRQNRKSKSSASSPTQNTNFSKFSPKSDKRRSKSPTDQQPLPPPPLSWPVNPPPPPVSKPTRTRKISEDDKVDTCSASSISSSRSRGSSVSSENKESDRKQTNGDDNVIKRKRKNKLSRQPSFVRDLDDSSTTTDKSMEDYEVKQVFRNPVQETIHEQNSKTYKRHSSHKASSDSDCKDAHSVPLQYQVTYEPQNLRRRHNRANAQPNLKDVPLHKPKFNKKTSFRLRYDNTTSSADEPIWDSPKVAHTQSEADEVLRSLSETTRKVDGKMHKPHQRKKEKIPTSGRSFDTFIPRNVTVQSPGISSNSSSFAPSPRPNLTKAQSMPEHSSPPRQQNAFDAPSLTNRRYSGNENNKDYSGSSEIVNPAPDFSPVISVPAWNGFGQNPYSFNITEGFMRPAPTSTVLSSPTTPPAISSPRWGTYSTPSLFNNAPTTQPPISSTWNPNNLQINLPISTARTMSSPSALLPSSPVITESSTLGLSASPPGRSTHAIWSVRNAVTMDEDRNNAENDPLGVKSIWNEGSSCNVSEGRTSNFF